MLKKILKITGIVILVIFVLLVTIPFVFKGKIEQLIKDSVNENLNAKLEFAETDISLIRNFPNASVRVSDVSLVNYAPFLGDTLVAVKQVDLKMSLAQLFASGDEPLTLDYFAIDGAKVKVLVNENGEANYDISKETTTTKEETTTTESTSGFELSVSGYEITNSQVDYIDASTGMEFLVTDLNHSGSGDLSLDNSKLTTKTTANVSFIMDSTAYLNNNALTLDAVFGIDLPNNKYSFLDNKLLINKLPLVFDGYVQLLDEGQMVDISFKTPTTDFKNLLALIPETYSKDIEGVETKGAFSITGEAKGVIDETHDMPTLTVDISSDNASFKYPDLPKTVENISIKTNISNSTGMMDDMVVNVENFSFKIDQDTFAAKALMTNLMENFTAKANFKGTVNLANLSKAYPVELDIPLSGILKADISTAFDMATIESEQYQNTTNSGSMQLSGFTYNSDAMANPLTINKTALTFNNTKVSLNEFDAKSGSTDIKATGSISNFLGYMFNDELLKGNFDITSNNFALSDFMVEETEPETTTTETTTTPTTTEDAQIKIPDFLDATVTVNAKQVKYDNLNLTNAKGTLLIKDETATLKDVSSNLLGGTVTLNGSASTKGDIPNFNMDLGIKSFTISEAFKELELLKALAPIADAIEGTLNSSLSLSGNLDDSLAPDLTTLSGNALAELIGNSINTADSKVLSSLDSNLSFINLSDLNLKDLKALLEFENGKVTVSPFQIKYKDIAIDISGTHGFDQTMSYNATFNIPAKYLGSDVTKLLSQLNDSSMENTIVPVTANITGTFTSPKIKTDASKAVTDLTNQIIEKQKDKLVKEGTDKVKETLSGFLNGGNNETTTDTTDTKESDTKTDVKNAVKNTLNGLFNKKKKSDEEEKE
ncbi:AsmA-like C-terminal region-containing protein [Neptunitalea lumnitzerae]|uniref:AsmA domain-containing protein n=1 Tax=Neptunitalea lumnitzerae TaxID=2965509 RepID=A0ABQ5MHX8_9FLAO|nr:AsmA-like C-terminal region-containing protein [Neptunitalea sp. Y10]GLB48985.1 hypothetical protein Y10_13530 [Neptunitalea sp. Y10]